MRYYLSGYQLLIKILLALLVSALIGGLFNQALLAMFLMSLGVLAWNCRHLFQLSHWLWQSKSISPPQAEGLWGRVYDGLYNRIAQQRKKYKRLNLKMKKFRDAAEALPDAALVLGDDLIIQWGNKKAQGLLGVQWPGDIGQRIDNLLRDPEFIRYLNAQSYDHPCLLNSPVDSSMKLELRFIAYGSDQILLLARDVSRIQRLEEMRRDFVANVSHELKTPLTVVRGYVEMVQLSSDVIDSRWQQAFATMETQVTRMDRLVEQLLNLSKVESATDDEKQLINMPALIQGLVNDCSWLNQEKQHNITVDVDDSLGIIGIETELKSACANLIANAIAYTPAHGKIQVLWKKHERGAIFVVEDNGVGIKPENIRRLTERFFRIDKSRSRDTGGSGLGLAIVKHVLNHHNASLNISSEWEKGSQFTINFNAKSLQNLSR